MRRKASKRKKRKIPKKGNAEMIRAFLENSGVGSDYEVWAPYIYHGLIGFVDLVLIRKERTFLFEFLPKVKEMEKAVKNTKLKAKIFRKKKEVTKTVDSYMVLEDKEENRKVVVQNDSMLENQPFGILFFDGEKTVSYSGTKRRVPRLFQTRGVELERSALAYLIEKPNHEEIEEAILNLTELPETIDREFVKGVERYVKVKGVPPKDTSSLVLKRTRESEKGESNV